jgi:VCBS repeat-containing protein
MLNINSQFYVAYLDANKHIAYAPAKFLTGPDGQPVINPNSTPNTTVNSLNGVYYSDTKGTKINDTVPNPNPGNWLVVPVNYSVNSAIQFANDVNAAGADAATAITAAGGDGSAAAAAAYANGLAMMTGAFLPSGSQNLQTTYQNSSGSMTNSGQSVPMFQDAASYSLGIISQLTGYGATAAQIGGSILAVRLVASPLGISGTWNNNLRNMNSISAGAAYIQTQNTNIASDSVPTVSTVVAPPGLGTPARNSAGYFTANDSISVVVNPGGTLSDIWVTQGSALGFTTANDFYAAIQVCNPSITNIGNISAGQIIYLPKKLPDGSVTYNYAGGISTNINATTGEVHSTAPDGNGGTVVSVNKIDATGNSVLQQTATDQGGNVTVNSVTTSTYTDSSHTTLATQITVSNDFTTNISTTSTINYHPNDGINVCTFDTSTTQIGSPSQSIGEITGNISVAGSVSAYISGAAGLIDLSNSAITLAPGATATIAGDGNTITVDNKDQISVVGNGNTTKVAPPSGIQTVIQALPTVIDALSFIRAIQTGQALPVVASGLNLVNALTSTTARDTAGNIVSVTPASYGLAGASSVASGILSIMSLDAALKRGDTLGAVVAGTQALSAGLQAYTSLAAAQGLQVSSSVTNLSTTLNGTPGVPGVSVIGALNLVNSIAHNDSVGAAMAVISMTPAAPVAWAYYGFQLITSLFGDNSVPDPWGSGHYVWNGMNTGVSAVGATGGDQVVSGFMNQMLSSLNTLIAQEQQQNPGSALGLIPNRMPTLSYGMQGYNFTDIDPVTGVQKNPGLRYDTSGKPYNATPGSPESFMSLGQAFITSAIARGAIAPQWEVQTAAMQVQAGDPLAGLPEEARAARAGDMATAQTGSTQLWRPVVLDLNGSGIQTISAAQSGVSFNVDDSGFLKSTAWIGSNDAFLTIDKNYNGVIDSGKELFSNGAVGLGHRGVASLAAVDANYDGVINALDPVYSQMKLWQDKNGNGVVDAGELTTLAQNGITQLNYTMNTFVKNGVTLQMASPDLAASTAGEKVSVVPQGILLQSSGGQTSLLVTRVDDLTGSTGVTTPPTGGTSVTTPPTGGTGTTAIPRIQANPDHVTGIENVELIVSSADLLKNDTYGGIRVNNLKLTGVLNARHGTCFLDANGYVHFQPETNYYGEGAGFDYSVTGQNGQTGTASVQLSLTHVNQAPTVVSVTHDTRPVYGYTPGRTVHTVHSKNHSNSYIHGVAIYTPYTKHTTPIAYVDPGSGMIVANDVDNALSTLKYTVIGQPQQGAVSVDATGHYQYTSWSRHNVSSGAHYRGEPTNTDSFQVSVTDPLGASVTQTVNVTHYGTYTPPTPAGGGGGGGGCLPVAIDMSNQGFSFTPVDQSNVFIDVNSDGWKHQISWIKPGEGLLAYDPNGSGKVTDVSQISFTKYLTGAQTDLAGLAAFDTNHDGIFSNKDAAWSKFGIWMDANQNGVVDAGEFKTLDQMGVASISLVSDNRFSVVNGNTVHGIAKVTMSDGTTRNAADVTLAYSRDVQVSNPDGTKSVVTPSPFPASGQQVSAGAGNNLVLPTTGNTNITVGDGNNVVFSGDGNDIIKAGKGNNVIYAGNGDDVIMAGGGNNVIYTGRGNDLILAGNGHNALFAGGGNDIIFAGNGNNLISGGTGNDVIRAGDGNNTINAGDGNTAVFAGNGDNTLIGGAGTNRFQVGNGNNSLVSGSGVATLIAGTGNNTFVINNVNDVVQAQSSGSNINTVQASVSYVTPANVRNLKGIGSADITLTGNNPSAGSGQVLDHVITGNAGRDTLIAGVGNDTLIAGSGIATMIGGTGNDTFVVNNANDVVLAKFTGSNVNTVLTSVNLVTPANVQHLTGIGHANITLAGNNLNNVITANNANDTLIAGSGIATMIGGTGNDTFVVNNVSDVVQAKVGGINTIQSSVSYTASANVKNLVGTGNADIILTGNNLGDVITGNAGRDTLIAGTGNDTLIAGSGIATMLGGIGNDIFVINNVGDVVQAKVGGINTIQSSVSYTASANVQNLTGVGNADITLTGNNLNNVITANNANDTLIAGSGTATMIGGAGNDTFVVNNANDVVLAKSNGSNTNTVKTSVSYVTPANIQNLTGIGSANITLTGNNMNNVITANNGNDTLVAGSGNDTLIGGAGNDTFVLNGGQQTIIDTAKAVGDTVQFGAGITGWNTLFNRQGSDMLVKYGTLGGSALIKNFAGAGQVISSFQYSDGSRSRYFNDSQGNTSVNTYAVNGKLLADFWWHIDGSYGSNIFYANGSYRNSWSKRDGSRSFSSYNTVTGEMTAISTSVAAGYTYTSEYYQNMGGVYGLTESKAYYVYTDGSTYSTDYTNKSDGSYRQSWARSNGSHGLTDYNAPNGEMIVNTTTIGTGYSSISDYHQNIGGVYGYNESKASNVYTNGVANSSYYVQNIHGVYGCNESKAYNKNADGSSYATDYLQNIGGIYGHNESKTANIYADGSRYNTDYVSYADGSHIQSWDRSNGTSASAVFHANGSWADNCVNADGSQVVDSGYNHLLLGASANDKLTAPYGNSLLIGGAGNDTLVTGYGSNIIAFNKGDGQDTLYASSGQNNTLTLGGKLAYNDLALQKSGTDLILDVGTADSITLKNWYLGSKNIVNLQVVASSMSDFNPASTNVLSNSNIEEFNFQKLVSAFDQARVTSPGLTAWGVTNALLDAHLASSNTAALGGDLAYVYGTHGSLTGFGVSAAQNELSNTQFAAAPQSLSPWPVLNTGTAQIR